MYVLSREAGIDLAEIEDYTARKWSDDQAEKYLRELFRALEALARDPGLGRRRADVPPPYLVYSVGSHLIVYRYLQPANRVEVLNILHPAMDIATRLKKALARAAQQRIG
ncbi:MAG TPA: type II toxin-antitoxin system RelE/ParE family toxin [Stellaceae bacterium]|nr:type II toxin-antitoxin system RelE/ParE family toxin [Stellaceae bacterium]